MVFSVLFVGLECKLPEIFLSYLFMYFWIYWVVTAAHRLSLVVSRSYSLEVHGLLTAEASPAALSTGSRTQALEL